MRKLIALSLGLVMIALVTGCSAGVDNNGAGVTVGFNDSSHYTA